SERRNQRDHGRLRAPLPARAGSHLAAAVLLRGSAGLVLSRLLVRDSADDGPPEPRPHHGRAGRSRRLGSRRWLRGGCGVDQVLPEAPLDRRQAQQSEALARRDRGSGMVIDNLSDRSPGRPHPLSIDPDRLRRMPKAELHVHLDGSLRPTTMLELAAEQQKRLPRSDARSLRDYMHVTDARNLVEYLERFEVTLSLMQTAESLERIAYELAEDLAGENVRYAEIRYSPLLHTRDGLPLTEAVDAPLRGLARAERELGIRTALIICGIRNMDPATSRDLADLTVAYKGRGVVAFDLAGAEYNYPAKKHRDAFYTVINRNMATTIHAG